MATKALAIEELGGSSLTHEKQKEEGKDDKGRKEVALTINQAQIKVF
jgi:hypothetical protein